MFVPVAVVCLAWYEHNGSPVPFSLSYTKTNFPPIHETELPFKNAPSSVVDDVRAVVGISKHVIVCVPTKAGVLVKVPVE